MNQVTVAIHLDEQVYNVLAHYAAVAHRDLGVIVNEILSEKLSELSLRMEAERVRALPLTERRELARRAWGSWTLPTETNSVDLVRQLRAEWTR